MVILLNLISLEVAMLTFLLESIFEEEGCAMDSCNPCVVRLCAKYCCSTLRMVLQG